MQLLDAQVLLGHTLGRSRSELMVHGEQLLHPLVGDAEDFRGVAADARAPHPALPIGVTG